MGWKKKKVLGTQSCLTLCSPMNCSLTDSSVRGILQAGLLEWIAFLCARGSSWPRNRTRVSCIAGGFFTIWANRKPILNDVFNLKMNNNQTKYGKWKAAIAVLGLFSLSKNVYLLATEIIKKWSLPWYVSYSNMQNFSSKAFSFIPSFILLTICYLWDTFL